MAFSDKLRIWCNQRLPDRAQRALEAGVRSHELIIAADASESNLDASERDEVMRGCDVAFGQPHPRDVIESSRLKWVHLSTAGYTTYDRDDLRRTLRERKGALTTSSSVYSEPCAQHVLAMMLSLARNLPDGLRDQADRRWDSLSTRARSRLLVGDIVVIAGYGSIGRRLVQLLQPFAMNIIAVRRSPGGDEGVPTVPMADIASSLAQSDHVVDLLPAGVNTLNFFDAKRFAQMKRGARFYNVGRGTTVDQPAIIHALRSRQLGAAYLDVTTPEPLPPNDPLWTAPNCYITPHSAGGHEAEYERLVEHFIANLKRYCSDEPFVDRIV